MLNFDLNTVLNFNNSINHNIAKRYQALAEQSGKYYLEIKSEIFNENKIKFEFSDKFVIPFSVTIFNYTFMKTTFYRLVSRKLPPTIHQYSNFEAPFEVNIGEEKSFLIQIGIEDIEDLEWLRYNDLAFVLYSDNTTLSEIDFAINIKNISISYIKHKDVNTVADNETSLDDVIVQAYFGEGNDNIINKQNNIQKALALNVLDNLSELKKEFREILKISGKIPYREFFINLVNFDENTYLKNKIKLSIFRHQYYDGIVDYKINASYQEALDFFNNQKKDITFLNTEDIGEIKRNFDCLLIYITIPIFGTRLEVHLSTIFVKNYNSDLAPEFTYNVVDSKEFASTFQNVEAPYDLTPNIYIPQVKYDLSTDTYINENSNSIQYGIVYPTLYCGNFQDIYGYKIINHTVTNLNADIISENDITVNYVSTTPIKFDDKNYIIFHHSKEFCNKVKNYNQNQYFDITEGELFPKDNSVHLYDIDFTIEQQKYIDDTHKQVYDNTFYIIKQPMYLTLTNNVIYSLKIVSVDNINNGMSQFTNNLDYNESINVIQKIRIFNNGNKNLLLTDVSFFIPQLSIIVDKKNDEDFEKIEKFYKNLKFNSISLYNSFFDENTPYEIIAPNVITVGEYFDIYIIYKFNPKIVSQLFKNFMIKPHFKFNFDNKVSIFYHISENIYSILQSFIDINNYEIFDINDLILKSFSPSIRQFKLYSKLPLDYKLDIINSIFENYQTILIFNKEKEPGKQVIYSKDDKEISCIFYIRKEEIEQNPEIENDIIEIFQKDKILEDVFYSYLKKNLITDYQFIRYQKLIPINTSKFIDEMRIKITFSINQLSNLRTSITYPDKIFENIQTSIKYNPFTLHLNVGKVRKPLSGYITIDTKYFNLFKIVDAENINIKPSSMFLENMNLFFFEIPDMSKNTCKISFSYFNIENYTFDFNLYQDQEESYLAKYVDFIVTPDYYDLGYIPIDSSVQIFFTIYNKSPIDTTVELVNRDIENQNTIIIPDFTHNPIQDIIQKKFRKNNFISLKPFEKINLQFKIIPRRIGLNFFTLFFKSGMRIRNANIEFKSFVNNKPYFILDEESRVKDFGTVPIGEVVTDTITIHNIGKRLGRINNIYLTGNDSQNFKIINPSTGKEATTIPYNKIILPHSSITIPVKFYSRNYGFNYTYMYIETNEPILSKWYHINPKEENSLTEIYRNAPKYLTSLLKGNSIFEEEVIRTDSYVFLGYINPVKSKFRSYFLKIYNNNKNNISKIVKISNIYNSILKVSYSKRPFNKSTTINLTLNPKHYSEGQYYDELIIQVKSKPINSVRQKFYLNKIPILQYVTRNDYVIFEVDTKEFIFVAKPYIKYYKEMNIYNYSNVDATFYFNLLNDYNGLFSLIPDLNNKYILIPEGMNYNMKILFGGSQEFAGEYKTNLTIKAEFAGNSKIQYIPITGYIGDYNIIKWYKRSRILI